MRSQTVDNPLPGLKYPDSITRIQVPKPVVKAFGADEKTRYILICRPNEAKFEYSAEHELDDYTHENTKCYYYAVPERDGKALIKVFDLLRKYQGQVGPTLSDETKQIKKDAFYLYKLAKLIADEKFAEAEQALADVSLTGGDREAVLSAQTAPTTTLHFSQWTEVIESVIQGRYPLVLNSQGHPTTVSPSKKSGRRSHRFGADTTTIDVVQEEEQIDNSSNHLPRDRVTQTKETLPPIVRDESRSIAASSASGPGKRVQFPSLPLLTTPLVTWDDLQRVQQELRELSAWMPSKAILSHFETLFNYSTLDPQALRVLSAEINNTLAQHYEHALSIAFAIEESCRMLDDLLSVCKHHYPRSDAH
jgi:hypothetical protein